MKILDPGTAIKRNYLISDALYEHIAVCAAGKPRYRWEDNIKVDLKN
jgi:hypothetical protein